MSEQRPLGVLFLGPSGTGKSFGASLLCRRIGHRVTVTNGPTEVYEKWNDQVDATPWEELPLDDDRVTYVLEDLHRLKESSREVVATLLNYTSRHRFSTTIIIAHSFMSNGLFSLLNFLTDVYVTSNNVNLRSLRVLLKHFYYENANEVVECFLKLPPHHYLHLRPQQLSFASLTSRLDPASSACAPPAASDPSGAVKTTLDKDDLIKYFSHLPDSQQYANLADYILRILPAECITAKTLSVSFRNKKKEIKTLSLVDYLHFLMSKEKPPAPFLAFQRHLLRTACFPSTLIRNEYMKKVSR